MTNSPKFSLDHHDIQSAFRHAITGGISGLILSLPVALQMFASSDFSTGAIMTLGMTLFTALISGLARGIERYVSGLPEGEKGEEN